MIINGSSIRLNCFPPFLCIFATPQHLQAVGSGSFAIQSEYFALKTYGKNFYAEHLRCLNNNYLSNETFTRSKCQSQSKNDKVSYTLQSRENSILFGSIQRKNGLEFLKKMQDFTHRLKEFLFLVLSE